MVFDGKVKKILKTKSEDEYIDEMFEKEEIEEYK